MKDKNIYHPIKVTSDCKYINISWTAPEHTVYSKYMHRVNIYVNAYVYICIGETRNPKLLD